MKEIYEAEFRGMTDDTVSYDDLIQARAGLLDILKRGLTKDEKEFLISFKNARPDWNLLGIGGVENLPAVRWKQMIFRKWIRQRKKYFSISCGQF